MGRAGGGKGSAQPREGATTVAGRERVPEVPRMRRAKDCKSALPWGGSGAARRCRGQKVKHDKLEFEINECNYLGSCNKTETKLALPTAYLQSAKNLSGILDSIKTAQAPEKFTTRFLTELGFASSSDRTIISVLKALGFLDADGKPTDRYYRFLDQSQSQKVLAEGIRDAYSDLFKINTKAQTLKPTDISGKFKTLSEGKFSESVLQKHVTTFTSLVKLADFSEEVSLTDIPKDETFVEDEDPQSVQNETSQVPPTAKSANSSLGGLHYNIQIILPTTRDVAVYDAIFRSLKDHLIE